MDSSVLFKDDFLKVLSCRYSFNNKEVGTFCQCNCKVQCLASTVYCVLDR